MWISVQDLNHGFHLAWSFVLLLRLDQEVGVGFLHTPIIEGNLDKLKVNIAPLSNQIWLNTI